MRKIMGKSEKKLKLKKTRRTELTTTHKHLTTTFKFTSTPTVVSTKEETEGGQNLFRNDDGAPADL